MAKQGVTKIDIKQVLAQKAPKASRKIPGFIVDYLIRTVHQEELNDILTRYHDKEGVDFMRELIGYFDLTLDLVHEENIPTEGRYIFASNHPLGGLDGICLSAVIGSRFEGRIKYPVNVSRFFPEPCRRCNSYSCNSFSRPGFRHPWLSLWYSCK